VIESLNIDLTNQKEEASGNVSIGQNNIQEIMQEQIERISSLEEEELGEMSSLEEGDHGETNTLKTSSKLEGDDHEDTSLREDHAYIHPTNLKKGDIRSYFKKKDAIKVVEVEETETSNEEEPITAPDNNGNQRMAMMRGKMTKCRKRQEVLEKRKQRLLKRHAASKSHMGKRVIQAKDVTNTDVVQDDQDLVVTGADVEGLYPSLSDIEVAIIVYIMNSGIKFENFDFRVAGKYVACHITEVEQRLSPLSRILPRRVTKGNGGVRPGVSADPKKDDNWLFPKAERTELEERMLVAMDVQIGVIAVMNTHQYSFNGKTFLQKAGGPI
jgi:hypothetical protein